MRSGADPKPYYNLREFADVVGVSYSTAKRMVCEGAIQRVRLHAGGRKLVPRFEVERILAKFGVAG